MTSTKTKIAPFLFLVFFNIWVTVLWATCFPSGAWANPVRFPNILMLTLFMVSGSIAAISGAVIGLEYLGIHFILEHRDSILTVRKRSFIARKSRVPTTQQSRVPTTQQCQPLVVQEFRALAAQECRALAVQEFRSDRPNIEKQRKSSVIAEQEETERAR